MLKTMDEVGSKQVGFSEVGFGIRMLCHPQVPRLTPLSKDIKMFLGLPYGSLLPKGQAFSSR